MCGGPLVGRRRVAVGWTLVHLPIRGTKFHAYDGIAVAACSNSPMPESMPDPTPQLSDATPDGPKIIVVVARRYRPQVFEDLIGQEHVAQALSNAITTNRVGPRLSVHRRPRRGQDVGRADLRQGAELRDRARRPCPATSAKSARASARGDDVDVLEIDGASNRGIDEIRQLRQNVNVRPSRARLKIYIIDEVHMLTARGLQRPAEDARRAARARQIHLLHDRPEQDPDHDPVAVPAVRLRGHSDRLDRRAACADRRRPRASRPRPRPSKCSPDGRPARCATANRCLEQLLAFAPERITLADVHGMLGTAGDERLAELVEHLVARDAAAALADLDAAMGQGVDVGLLLEQLFGYLRDCMAAAVGCPAETFLYASPSTRDQVIAARQGAGAAHDPGGDADPRPDALAAAPEHPGRVIWPSWRWCESAHLEDLDELGALVGAIEGGTAAAAVECRAAPQPIAAAAAVPLATARCAPDSRRSGVPQQVRWAARPPLAETGRDLWQQTQLPRPPPPPIGAYRPKMRRKSGAGRSPRCSGMLAENARQAWRA